MTFGSGKDSFVNIRLPITLPFWGDDTIQQNAQIAQVRASIEEFAAGIGHPYTMFNSNFDEELIDYNYNFNSITLSPYTPSSIFGSPILLLQQAAELSEGLDFIDGRWSPAL